MDYSLLIGVHVLTDDEKKQLDMMKKQKKEKKKKNKDKTAHTSDGIFSNLYNQRSTSFLCRISSNISTNPHSLSLLRYKRNGFWTQEK
jgi:hypothetical protein